MPSKHHSKVTPRDQAVLRDLWLCRYLTSHQISRLHFGHLKLAQRRLRRLRSCRLVDRFRLEGDVRSGFQRYVYRLAGPGARIVAEAIDEDPKRIRPPKRPPTGRSYMAHHRLLTDFRIWLREGCQGTNGLFGFRFVPGYEEVRLQGRRRRRVALNINSVSRLLVPDAVFSLHRRDGKAALFAVEVDRGTEPLRGRHRSSVAKKLALYATAFDAGVEQQYSRLFGHSFSGFRVLCLVPDDQRRRGFLRLAEEAALAPLVWVGLHSLSEEEGDLGSAAWINQRNGPTRSLLE